MKSSANLVLGHILWRGMYFISVLLLNILIARFFAAEKSGQIFFIVNNLAFILLLASVSLESGSTYYISSGILTPSQMAGFLTGWSLMASLMAAAAWAVILLWTGAEHSKDAGFQIASFMFILGVLLTTYFTSLFYATMKFSLPNKILFLINCGFIVFLIACKNHAAVRSMFILFYFFSFFLQGIALMILFFIKNPRNATSWLPPGSVLKKVFRYSTIALLANGIYFLVNRIDYWLVQYYCTPDDMGNYVQASKLAQMLFILPGIVASTLFPVFSSRNKSENIAQVAAAMRMLFVINLSICLLICSVGWYFIPIVFGPSFHQLYKLFILLVPGIIAVSMNYPLSIWFSADKRIAVNISGSLLALIVIFAGDLFFLPYYGIQAASVVSSGGFLVYFGYTLFMFCRENSVSPKEMLIIKKADIHKLLRTIKDYNLKSSVDKAFIKS